MNYNALTVEVYSSGMVRLDEASQTEDALQNIVLRTIYPGGVFLQADMLVRRDIAASWAALGAKRVVVRNGYKTAFEGYLFNLRKSVEAVDQYTAVKLVGAWGKLMTARRWRKPWADTRIADDVWIWQTAATAAELMSIERTNRLYIKPEDLQVGNGVFGAPRYTAPTGQTVKRVTFNYDFSEQAVENAAKIFHYDSAGPSYTDLTAAYDGSLTVGSTLTFTTGDYLYVGARKKDILHGVKFTMGGTVNAVNSVMTAEYWNGTAWTAVAISDGTAVAGKTWAQSGDVTFTQPGDIDETSVNSSRLYWVRFAVSVNLTAGTVINELRIMQNQAWEMALRNIGLGTDVVSVTSTGTGSTDHTLATPSQAVELRFYSRADQFGIGNGSIHAKWTNITVYTETGAINLTEVVKDIRAFLTEINSDETQIDSNTFSIVPFASEWSESLADVVQRAAAFGDSSYNRWAVGLRESEAASAPDGKPVLFAEAFPALSSADYVVSTRDTNLVPPFSLEQDFNSVANWMIVKFTDENGWEQYMTPDDDATLTDAASVSKYGQRDYLLDMSRFGRTPALNAALKYLAAYKNPIWRLAQPLRVQGYILDVNGVPTPSSLIRAGMRVRIDDLPEDATGLGVTFLISGTTYTDGDEVCAMTVDVPDDLAVFLTQMG